MPRFSSYTLVSFALVSASLPLQADQPVFTLPSSRPSVQNGWNLSIQGDFLYWQATETGLSYAINQDFPVAVNPSTLESEFMGSGKAATPSFDWQSGFRIGLGYNIPHDQWDLDLLWTCCNGEGNNSQESNNPTRPTILTSYVHPNSYNNDTAPVCMKASADLSIGLNVVDLDLARQFKVGKWLSLRPHFGARSVWLDQTYNVRYEDLYATFHDEAPTLESYLTPMTNNFWGVGGRAGFGMDFGLKWGISLFGDLAFSLLYGVFDVTRTERLTLSMKTSEGENIEATVFLGDEKFHAGTMVTDIALGLRWSTGFAKDRIRLLLQAGWEQHMFFSQNQFMKFSDGQYWGNFTQNQGDVYFQGATGSVRLYF